MEFAYPVIWSRISLDISPDWGQYAQIPGLSFSSWPQDEYPSEPNARSLDWSPNGLLTGVQEAAGNNVEYEYTADGLLNSRNVDSSTSNDEFVWDSTASNALLLSDGEYEYIYGPNRVPIAQIDLATNEVEYLHADSNGSVIAATTDDGYLAGTTNYGAYYIVSRPWNPMVTLRLVHLAVQRFSEPH